MAKLSRRHLPQQYFLLFSVMVIATCGLVYELLAATLSSYLLGDSVTQFSLIIGVYLFSMGLGSYLSKYINVRLLDWFIQIEVLVSLIGGLSASVLFLAFPLVASFQMVLYPFVVVIGTLVGVEIPLLLKILKDQLSFNELVSRVFTFDYMGALLASIIFPLVFVPHLGLIRTSLFFGIFNLAIAMAMCYYFSSSLVNARKLKVLTWVVLLIELFLFVIGDRIQKFSDSLSFSDYILFSKTTPYQRIVLTKHKQDIRLYLNGNLQFSSKDEYRYHEALIHPCLTSYGAPKSVLVLGGGDGLALREILKYPSVESVDLVDLDPEVTRLFSSNPLLLGLNKASFSNMKVSVKNADAFVWVKANKRQYDCIIIDFPDPSTFSVGKLYTSTFYKFVKAAMHERSVLVVQSTSPIVAPKSFWCINHTLESLGFNTLPYHNFVPSFGEWGYTLAAWGRSVSLPDTFFVPHKFINRDVMRAMTVFPEDMKVAAAKVEVNQLNNQVLVRYFEDEWSSYVE